MHFGRCFDALCFFDKIYFFQDLLDQLNKANLATKVNFYEN